ncbi:MAG TPA: PEGA domain-containing protein [Vicinamibacterales bacterium]|nr:PEGA domain-containing protein [Vicinamibacterales bacterium]
MPGTPDARSCTLSTAGFEDGLGRRSIRFDRTVGGTLECLHVRPEFGILEPLLRDSAAALAALEDERFARILSVERDTRGLVVISELVPGERLGDILDTGRAQASGVDAAVGFLLQTLPALARLHDAGLVHGTVSPDRILITPAPLVVLLDPIYATALERLRLTRRTLWESFGLLAPQAAGGVRLLPALDVAQVSMAALALALGRPLQADAAAGLASLVHEAAEIAQIRGGEPFAAAMRRFFDLTLPSDRRGQGLPADAALEEVRAAARFIGDDVALAALGELLRDPHGSDTDLAGGLMGTAPAATHSRPETPDVTLERVDPPRAAAPPAPILPPPPAVPATATMGVAPLPAPRPLRIKAEGPPGYVPPRTAVPVTPDMPARALPFVNRTSTARQGSRWPWKLAAASVLVVSLGTVAGRDYMQGRAESAPAAPRAAAPTPAAVTDNRPQPRPDPAGTGTLAVQSQPAGARVALNGADVGVTPLTLDTVPAGRHVVSISTDTATVRRTVSLEAGGRAAIDVPVYSGWIAVFAPIRVHVSSGGRTLGTSESRRIMLPPGRQAVTFSNAELGFSTTQVLEISPGEERAINLAPRGTVHVNAHPWAEVWVDGARVGETPLANLEVGLGTREFVFRHPQYGERKIITTVTTRAAALTIDFTKPAEGF